jgi:hypothetical protein
VSQQREGGDARARTRGRGDAKARTRGRRDARACSRGEGELDGELEGERRRESLLTGELKGERRRERERWEGRRDDGETLVRGELEREESTMVAERSLAHVERAFWPYPTGLAEANILHESGWPRLTSKQPNTWSCLIFCICRVLHRRMHPTKHMVYECAKTKKRMMKRPGMMWRADVAATQAKL